MNIKRAGKLPGDYFMHLKKMRLETLFIIIFLTFGIVFAAIVPPGWNTDETDHSYRIYQLSTGNLFSEKVTNPYHNGIRAYGGSIPLGLTGLFDRSIANEPGSVGNPDRKIDKNIYTGSSGMLALKDDGRQRLINFSGAALYSPVSYIIYIPVFILGKLLSLPFFWIIILSRLVGLAFVGLAFYFAIKFMPVGKWLIFTVGLLPSVVTQAVSVGADAPELAVCVLFIALITRFVYLPRKLKLLDYAIFSVLGIVLALTKVVYFPLVFLLLALPLIKKDYRNRRSIIMLSLTVIISIVPTIIWTNMVSYVDINSNPQADFEGQKTFILTAPVAYLKTLYYTFLTNAQTTPLNNIFGNFIWGSAPLPAFYAYLSAAAVTLSLLVKSASERLKKMTMKEMRVWRGVLIGMIGTVAVLIASTLYIYSTTLRQSSVVGIQSRYFLPLLPLVLLLFYGNTVKNQDIVKKSIVIISCIVLVGSVLTIHYRLYNILPPVI